MARCSRLGQDGRAFILRVVQWISVPHCRDESPVG